MEFSSYLNLYVKTFYMANPKTKSSKNLQGINGKKNKGTTYTVITPLQKTKEKNKPAREKNISVPDPDSSISFDSKQLLKVLMEVKNGNFSVRMPIDEVGLNGKICDTLNDIIVLNERMMYEFTKAGSIIGKQGKLTQRIEVPNAKGSWGTGVDSLNTLISDLVHPTIEIAHVISSVAQGNLSQEMPLEIGGHTLKGEFSRIAKEVNDMVKQLNLFSMEVTRVAREVGSEGKLGGQAKVKGVAGVWKDLTDSVTNGQQPYSTGAKYCGGNHCGCKRGLSKKITVDVKGEILGIKK
jgi:HAMP domain-containing protein